MNAVVDKLATSNDEIWREAAERLRIGIQAESENRIKGIEAKMFRWGDQWDADVRNTRKIQQRPSLTINHTNTFASRLENTLRQQRPRIKCHPVGDGADIDTASTVNGLIRHIENRSQASVAYDLGVSSALDIGWGYWRIVSEYLDNKSFDQELLIRGIRNTFTVYMDPAAAHPTGCDAMWVIITEKMKRIEYRRRYPNGAGNDYAYAMAPGDLDSDWESKEEIRLAEYYRIFEKRDRLVRMTDGSIKLESELPKDAILQAMQLGIAVGKDGRAITRPSVQRVVQWRRLDGTKCIDERDLPGQYIPVIRCEGNVSDINGLVKRKGMIEDLKDPAQMYNYWRTAETERYALAPKAPWIGAEGQFDGHPEWMDANQKSYSTLIYKPVLDPNGQQVLPPPQRTQPAPVEAGMAQAAQGAEHDLMSVAGMPQENPEIASRVVGGNKYLQRRQGMQDLTHFQYYDNQTLAIAWTGSLLLDLIPYYYDTERMQRIIGEDGVPQMVKINERSEEAPAAQGAPDGAGGGEPAPNPMQAAIVRVKNDMTVGRYAVVMDTGPGYATRREEAAESMVELLNTPLGEVIIKTGPDLVLRNMDFHGADELADRAAATTPGGMDKIMEGLPKQAQTIIGALQQQIGQKDQQIQQMALEIKYKGTIEQAKLAAKSDETDKKLEHDDKTNVRDNVTKMHDTTVRGETARDVAEIQAGAQLLNTNTEAAHDRAAARELVDKAVEHTKEVR